MSIPGMPPMTNTMAYPMQQPPQYVMPNAQSNSFATASPASYGPPAFAGKSSSVAPQADANQHFALLGGTALLIFGMAVVGVVTSFSRIKSLFTGIGSHLDTAVDFGKKQWQTVTSWFSKAEKAADAVAETAK